MSASRHPIAILGAGLTGSLIALALAKRRPDVDFILIEQSHKFGGGAIGPFFLSSIPLASGWLIEPLVVKEWAGYHVADPEMSRVLPGRSAYLVPEQIHAEIVEKIPAEHYRLGAQVAAVHSRAVALADGRQIPVSMVLDARGDAAEAKAGSLWCQTSSRLVQLPRDHGLELPILIDATFPETDWSYFQYCPMASGLLLIRYVRHSKSAAIRPIDEGILGNEQGKPVGESVTLQRLLPASPLAREHRDGNRIGVDGARASMWNPILSSPVSGAVRIAEAVASARDLSFSEMAPRLAELDRRAADYGRHFLKTIVALCGQASDAKAEALAKLCGAPAERLARIEAGSCRPSDFAEAEEAEAAGLEERDSA